MSSFFDALSLWLCYWHPLPSVSACSSKSVEVVDVLLRLWFGREQRGVAFFHWMNLVEEEEELEESLVLLFVVVFDLEILHWTVKVAQKQGKRSSH